MPVIESLKQTFERVTGLGRPSKDELAARVRDRKAWPSRFRDDGAVPNNPDLPFIHYRGALDLKGAADPAAVFEVLFAANGWQDAWRNGVYDFTHYHPRTHEVLGIAGGTARVRFGGHKGKVVALKAGDVAILPAGTGHQALQASDDLLVVGAYPPGGKYEEFRESESEHAQAIPMIAETPLPDKDPVYGPKGPLKQLWKRRKKR
jgi:uncharacterized protein YjlB